MANANSDHRRSSLTTGRPFSSEEEEDYDEFNGDPAAWTAFTDVFGQVQSVLDRNRALIHQVNENHQSKIRGNMVKNVALIQEINGNMSKVKSLYSDLSDNISGRFPVPSVSRDGNRSR